MIDPMIDPSAPPATPLNDEPLRRGCPLRRPQIDTDAALRSPVVPDARLAASTPGAIPVGARTGGWYDRLGSSNLAKKSSSQSSSILWPVGFQASAVCAST
jgi:hypothetical protein